MFKRVSIVNKLDDEISRTREKDMECWASSRRRSNRAGPTVNAWSTVYDFGERSPFGRRREYVQRRVVLVISLYTRAIRRHRRRFGRYEKAKKKKNDKEKYTIDYSGLRTVVVVVGGKSLSSRRVYSSAETPLQCDAAAAPLLTPPTLDPTRAFVSFLCRPPSSSWRFSLRKIVCPPSPPVTGRPSNRPRGRLRFRSSRKEKKKKKKIKKNKND